MPSTALSNSPALARFWVRTQHFSHSLANEGKPWEKVKRKLEKMLLRESGKKMIILKMSQLSFFSSFLHLLSRYIVGSLYAWHEL